MKTFHRNSLIATVLIVAGTLGFAVASNDDDKPKKPMGPREIVKAYLKAAQAGRVKEAAALGEPGKAPSRASNANDLNELEIEHLNVSSVHSDDQNALVVIGEVKEPGRRKGPLVFTLVKKKNRWLIRDIELESEESAKQEVERFLERYPDAKRIDPQSAKAIICGTPMTIKWSWPRPQFSFLHG